MSIRYCNKRQKQSEIHDGGKWNAVGQVVVGNDRQERFIPSRPSSIVATNPPVILRAKC